MKHLYMNLALQKAWQYQFLTYPNPAVGCMIQDKNAQILSIEAHAKAGEAHAELKAIQNALKHLNPSFDFPKDPNEAHKFICKNHANLLQNAIAYVTLEPCNHHGKTPPCAELFTALKFKKVFISIRDENKIASGGAEFLRQKGIEVETGICEREGKDLLKPFLKWQQGNFKLFKLALSMNGSPFGKIVSNELSRTYGHQIRSVIDALVVGGETIRKDKPTLDSRLCGGKAPNLCILSNQSLESFDQNIPLFQVKGRQIFTEFSKDMRFTMFEGGEKFLRTFKDEIDMFLIFQSATCNEFENIKLNLNFKALYRGNFGNDSYGIYEL